MLFENRKQISAEDLMLKYSTKENYNKLLKKPSFEVSKSRRRVDRLNGGGIKVNKSTGMRSHFMATDKVSNLKVEIRYAESNNTKIVGDRVVDQFEPRYVNTNGATFAFQNNIDLAVFNFLHPNNSLSPLRAGKGEGKYEYIDTKKRSAEKVESLDMLSDALHHAKTMKEDDLIIFAKGLGIKGIDKKDPEDVRADVMEYASKSPKIYNEKRNTQVTFIEGRIVNLIDRQVVKLSTVGSIRRWTWAYGEMEGEHILDIQNSTQDAKQSLKNFFFSDISKWMPILNNITTNMTVKEKLERDLRMMEEMQNGNDPSAAYQPEKVIGDALPAYLRTDGTEPVAGEKKVYTKEDAIKALTDDQGNPPHHKKVEAWVNRMNSAE